ncbi:hypothetical protein LB542_15870 [Mesorhizobium sp. BR1-1-9]|uniref:hypothetical protein n=1 Tax=Mesorhizobium sp. BR1-1-9 TaxID=2876646 RepID=UPI001CD167CF|nr:hypothetical protein [Mesorhizobium sp. BR1-1-9]MBZ9872330.1 hypothetical protein [Mesorhizobium sp. BR1-1-9]
MQKNIRQVVPAGTECPKVAIKYMVHFVLVTKVFYLPAIAIPRYGTRKERDETWTVFDLFTGLPAEIQGHPYIDLEMD